MTNPNFDLHNRAIARLERENAALREAAERLANAVTAYFNKRGVAHAERKGNEDIAEMADALSDYGYALNLLLEKEPC